MTPKDESGKDVQDWESGYTIRFDGDGKYNLVIPLSGEVLERRVSETPKADDPEWLVIERRRRKKLGIKNRVDRL